MAADIFVDTSGWAAWYCRKEQFHFKATELVNECIDQGHKLITTSYVIAELTALFNRLRLNRNDQYQLVDMMHSESCVTIIPVEANYLRASWNLWRSRHDKEWSLVDCSSFVIMEQLKLNDALTTDRHFDQAGFNCLIK